MITWIALAIGVILNAAANILVKAGVKGEQHGFLQRILSDPWYIAGMACFGAALVAYSYALTKVPLSIAYPIMTGAGMAIVCSAGYLFFQEPITTTKVLGMALIFTGITVLAR